MINKLLNKTNQLIFQEKAEKPFKRVGEKFNGLIKMKKVSLILGVLAITFSGFVVTNEISSTQSNYKEVTIGKQVWMTENLDVDKFRNGDPILHVKTEEEWIKAGEDEKPAWCYYNNDPANREKYGKLYNWYAVNDPRGLAPENWHIPTIEEWTQLTNYLGDKGNVGKKMKGTSGWLENGNGSNESGFSGQPGGFREYAGAFGNVGIGGAWWSSTEANFTDAYFYFLTSNNSLLNRDIRFKVLGFSVRCLKD